MTTMCAQPEETPDEGRDREESVAATGGVELAPGVVVPREALRFSATRSSGPGGQNVNKRSTKVELRVAMEALPISAAALRRLERLAGAAMLAGEREDGEGALELVIVSSETRSQRQNLERSVEKLRELVLRALTPPKPRRPTKPTRSSVRRRLDEKRRQGEKKRRRGGDAGE